MQIAKQMAPVDKSSEAKHMVQSKSNKLPACTLTFILFEYVYPILRPVSIKAIDSLSSEQPRVWWSGEYVIQVSPLHSEHGLFLAEA